METENNELQHPDFIWTWKESTRGQRQSIWLPYLKSIDRKPRTSHHWVLAWNGGEMDADLTKIDFIMLYGSSGSLPVDFLDELNEQRICLAIHRRNMPRPYLFLPASGSDDEDILSAQLLARDNANRSAYLARTFIREKLLATDWLIPVSGADYKRLAASRNVKEVRAIEASHAARYWPAFFETIGLEDQIDSRREFPHPVNSALDAGSFFLHGVLLRWVLFHKLSPFHGFLHQTTAYPSLIYDLIEPYRVWIDHSVAGAVKQVGANGESELIAATIVNLKAMLEESVYVPSTMQTVRRKSLLHGSVLALRAYLLGKQKRFVLPVEGVKKGGRPPKIAFSMPGYRKD